MKKLLTISLLTSSLLFGASVQETNKEATEFLKAKNPVEAYTILENSYIKGDYNNQTLFLLGTSAKQNNDLDNAIKYFEELLTKDKGANRVRLDLASIYYRKGDMDKAKELLLIVKSSNPPKKVGDNIDNFLIAIEKGTPKSWSVSFSLGYMYDSNANAGPDTDTILMYNLPFTLSGDAKQNSDSAFKYSASLNHLYKFESYEGLFWQSSLGFNVTDYNKLNNLDSLSLYLSSGPTWNKDKYTFSLPIILNTIKVGHTDRYYSYSKGIAPQISYKYAPNISFSGTLSLSKKTYYNAPTRDSSSVMLSLSSRYFLNQSSFISLGGYVGKETSKTQTYANASKGINAGYYKAFSQKLNIFLSGSYSATNYDGTEVAYNEKRKDLLSSASGNLSYFIDMIKSNLSFNVSYSKSTSSIDIYAYKRLQTGVTLSKSF